MNNENLARQLADARRQEARRLEGWTQAVRWLIWLARAEGAGARLAAAAVGVQEEAARLGGAPTERLGRLNDKKASLVAAALAFSGTAATIEALWQAAERVRAGRREQAAK
jgi:hypothetical protein